MYCVAGPNASRNALAQSANKVVQWVRREEERVFIIGGAVSLRLPSTCLFSFIYIYSCIHTIISGAERGKREQIWEKKVNC